MPKVIENLREDILAEAKRQVFEYGFEKMTIRSVAKGCGVASGTIYNYFPSKARMVAVFMLDDWNVISDEAKQKCATRQGAETAVKAVWDGVEKFRDRYIRVYLEKAAEKEYEVSVKRYHPMFRKQLRNILVPVCERYSSFPAEFLSEYVRENILTWTQENTDFESVYAFMKHLFTKEN